MRSYLEFLMDKIVSGEDSDLSRRTCFTSSGQQSWQSNYSGGILKLFSVNQNLLIKLVGARHFLDGIESTTLCIITC